MEIIFVAITQPPFGTVYPGTIDAVKAASIRSGCEVTLLSDEPKQHGLPANVTCFPIAPFWKPCEWLLSLTTERQRRDWHIPGILRWLVLYDYLEGRLTDWPVLVLDTDVLVFSDLTKLAKSFDPFDFCAMVFGTHTSAAYSLSNRTCLQAACHLVFALAKTDPKLNDMNLWREMVRSGQWRVGNLMADTNGVFDGNIHHGTGEYGEERYVMEPSSNKLWGPVTKKITWVNGSPYFTRQSDGAVLNAHWIHCWGSYKTRTKELLNLAGI